MDECWYHLHSKIEPVLGMLLVYVKWTDIKHVLLNSYVLQCVKRTFIVR